MRGRRTRLSPRSPFPGADTLALLRAFRPEASCADPVRAQELAGCPWAGWNSPTLRMDHRKMRERFEYEKNCKKGRPRIGAGERLLARCKHDRAGRGDF